MKTIYHLNATARLSRFVEIGIYLSFPEGVIFKIFTNYELVIYFSRNLNDDIYFPRV